MDRYTANRYIWLKDQIASGGSVPQELLDEVEALDETVNGNETSEPPVVGLVDIVGDLEDAVEDLDTDINGDDTTEPPTLGLKDRVSDLETTINGDSSVSPVIPPLLAGAGNMRVSELWSNSDPSQSYSSGNIALSSDDYDLLIWVFNLQDSGATEYSDICVKGGNVIATAAYVGGAAHITILTRLVLYTDATHYAIGDCNKAEEGSAAVVSNVNMIPYKVYGIKIMSN